jgi:hypothetical protein
MQHCALQRCTAAARPRPRRSRVRQTRALQSPSSPTQPARKQTRACRYVRAHRQTHAPTHRFAITRAPAHRCAICVLPLCSSAALVLTCKHVFHKRCLEARPPARPHIRPPSHTYTHARVPTYMRAPKHTSTRARTHANRYGAQSAVIAAHIMSRRLRYASGAAVATCRGVLQRACVRCDAVCCNLP